MLINKSTQICFNNMECYISVFFTSYYFHNEINICIYIYTHIYLYMYILSSTSPLINEDNEQSYRMKQTNPLLKKPLSFFISGNVDDNIYIYIYIYFIMKIV
jgi:hypothetical protein